MLNRFAFVALCGMILTGCARITGTYTNPVYTGDMPDPTVIRYKGVYYAFGTTGKRRVDGRIFTLLRSTNLVNWEKLGGALQRACGA